jgi:glycogen debranching enzyme
METVKILAGNTFVVSDDRGDIEASLTDPTGLFSFDTRHLSKWVLTINGERLTALSTDELEYFETRFTLVPGIGTVYVNASETVTRERVMSNGFHERLQIRNHGNEPSELTVRVEAACDFADLFEVKDALQKKGALSSRVEGRHLVLSYVRDTFARETRISSSEPIATIDENGLTFTIKVAPHDTWSTDLEVSISPLARREDSDDSPLPSWMAPPTRGRLKQNLDRWNNSAPDLECDWEPLKQVYAKSLDDLAALRFAPLTADRHTLPAAGLPWFMTMFGRDSIPHQLAGVAVHPGAGRDDVARARARQGIHVDNFRDEEPGRILHEMRYGELTAFEERPHSPYYGSADATPLYLVLLDEYERWTGDTKLVRQLEPAARDALNWIDEYADLQGNGYVAYQRRVEATGLENQCWKDSWDSISYRDGTLPGFPRATCELQGYAYDAKVRAARLARSVWRDADFADRLEREAADLKRRFNRDFWIEDGGYFAIALDFDGRQVDSLTSNNGHLLWSGIVDKSKARALVDNLMGRRLFSGWGVRTLAEGEARYNPIGYHLGTIWPFDNSFIAWGLRRYGFDKEAAMIAEAMLEAAGFFGGRLPEAFGGFTRRSKTDHPVPYPTACSPQAWSTGTPLLLLATMLGLQPVGDQLAVNPALPVVIESLQLLDIPGRWGRRDAFGRGQIDTSRRTRRSS